MTVSKGGKYRKHHNRHTGSEFNGIVRTPERNTWFGVCSGGKIHKYAKNANESLEKYSHGDKIMKPKGTMRLNEFHAKDIC